MKILIVSQYFSPEIGATQNRMFSFASEMAKNGHQVTVLCEFPNHPSGIMRPEYRRRWFESSREANFDIERVWVYASAKKTFWTRALFYASFMAASVIRGFFWRRRFDAVLATTPPLTVGVIGRLLAWRHRALFVLDVRDLWPKAAVEIGELKNPVLIALAEFLEKIFYRSARMIFVTTESFRDHVGRILGCSDKIHFIPNAANTDVFHPEACDGGKQPLIGFEGEFVVTFAGNHGVCQGLEYVLEGAVRLQRLDPKVRFLLMGEGPRKAALMRLALQRGITNVTFWPERPPEEAAEVLVASDALLVPYAPDAVHELSIPSKLYDFMSCGRPIILAAAGEARQVLEKAQSGLVAAPGDSEALAQIILKLKSDPNLRARLGRNGWDYICRNGASRRAQGQRVAQLMASFS